MANKTFGISDRESEPNPPAWPENVKVFDPEDPHTQSVIDSIFKENGGHEPPFHGEWSESRYALLFKPGDHNVDVNVGYYTSVIGLGKTPQETKIKTVICENGDFTHTDIGYLGALNNFWRSAENFYTKPSKTWNNRVTMLWAVSQASPLRRVFVDGDLDLFQYNSGDMAGFSSGGFLADSHITGAIHSGSQQQWLTRNTDMNHWEDGAWNMVFVGCNNAPAPHFGQLNGPNYTTIESAPVIAEKPYIILEDDRYCLMIPRPEINKAGSTTDFDHADKVDFSQVYVATEADDADVINGKLAAGLHVVLTPGNYNLTDSINVTKPGTCILGIGFPTLISTKGKPCIKVDDVDGVRIAGTLLQAGPERTEALLKWGNTGHEGSSANPGVISDCFARVGGTNDPASQPVTADIMVQINSGHVVCDNVWLWRADHGVNGLIHNSMNPCNVGCQVNGDNVVAYGLACEHTLGNLTEWNGENGRVYFYQSEYPYDVTQENYGDKGYASYLVGSNVKNHHAWGVGVYSYFRDNNVIVDAGIKTPMGPGIAFTNALSVFLGAKGQIPHVINDQGEPVQKMGQQAYVCQLSEKEINAALIDFPDLEIKSKAV